MTPAAALPRSTTMPPRAPTSVSRRTRLTGAARAAAGRVVEIVETDLLVWDTSRTLRTPRAQVDLRVVEVGVATPPDWRGRVPPALAADADAFLRRDDRGFMGLVDERFAGWVWVSRVTHRDPWSGLVLRLAADEAYAYALWVAPELRPKGVARSLMVAMLSAVQEDPAVSRVYGWVDKRNRESQMLLRLLGFADQQSVRRVMVLGRRGRQLPRTASPPFGPLSRAGRHSEQRIRP